MSIKAFKYRIYTNKATIEKLQWVLDRARELYNAALSERKEAWRMAGKSISRYNQQNDLPEIKELRPEYKEIGSHVLQNVIKRVDDAYQGFFRRIKNGETPGHPRFQGRNRYDSFTYPDHAGWKLEGKHLHLSKLGTIKVRLHRQIEGTIKTLTIKREGEHWYAIFNCEVETKKLPLSCEDVGVDLGITHFAALSDGTFIENPHHFRKSEKKLAKAQQALSRKRRGSHRRKKAAARVAKCHRKIRNQRRDFHHKASRKLVNQYQVIAFEDLQTDNLIKRPKAKQDENGTYLTSVLFKQS